MINSLTSSRIEEYIAEDNFKGTENCYINFEEFVQLLKVPDNDISFTLFSLFLEHGKSEDVIDLKEYLLHALFLIKSRDLKIELVKLLFMVSFSQFYGQNSMPLIFFFVSFMEIREKLNEKHSNASLVSFLNFENNRWIRSSFQSIQPIAGSSTLKTFTLSLKKTSDSRVFMFVNFNLLPLKKVKST